MGNATADVSLPSGEQHMRNNIMQHCVDMFYINSYMAGVKKVADWSATSDSFKGGQEIVSLRMIISD